MWGRPVLGEEAKPPVKTESGQARRTTEAPSTESPAQGVQAKKEKKAAEAGEHGKDWIRLLKNRQGDPVAMQTAIVRYVPHDYAADSEEDPAVIVDLVGAIHVGDEQYYGKLNKRFEEYDALLFELVGSDATEVQRGRGASSAHPVGAMQNGMKSLLDLVHQLDYIDYSKKNFVHADMSYEEFAASMEERDESFLKLYFRLIGQEMARQSKARSKGNFTDLDIISAFFHSDRTRRLKVALAQQFEDSEAMLTSLGGPDGTTIINERNRVAFEVLAKQIEAGKKQLGVFYGAGHLVDMDERLRQDFRLRPIKTTWIDAWDLRK